MYFINVSSADGIAVVVVCCHSMSSVQYACNSTEASTPMVLHIHGVTIQVICILCINVTPCDVLYFW